MLWKCAQNARYHLWSNSFRPAAHREIADDVWTSVTADGLCCLDPGASHGAFRFVERHMKQRRLHVPIHP